MENTLKMRVGASVLHVLSQVNAIMWVLVVYFSRTTATEIVATHDFNGIYTVQTDFKHVSSHVTCID